MFGKLIPIVIGVAAGTYASKFVIEQLGAANVDKIPGKQMTVTFGVTSLTVFVAQSLL